MIKNLTILLTLLFLTTIGFGQLMITEFMYNPPESGTDSLEYVEIYNAGSEAINMENYSLIGLEFTFPSMMVNAGEYVIVASNADAFTNAFGMAALQAEGGLNNSGELIDLKDDNGTSVSSVEYSDKDPWPTEADGDGFSLELCDGGDPANFDDWHLSSNDTGVMINGTSVFGTPGADNTSCTVTPDYVIESSNFAFTPSDITINVGETVLFTNVSGTHNVNGTQATFPDNPESFSSGAPAGGNWEYEFTFTIAGVYNFQCDPHAGSMQGTVTVEEVSTDDFPERDIDVMTTVDSEGVVDSLGADCTIYGLVYGVNLRPGGLQFTIIDYFGNGIGIYSDSDDLGYTVNEGDLLEVKGYIGQFNGLTQLYTQEVIVITQDDLFPSVVVTELNEDTESSLVTIEDVMLVNSGDWTGTGSGFNVDVTDGTNTYTVRIDNDVDLYDMAPPFGTFTVTGIGGQFDSETPYDDGYQLLPRYVADIDPYEPEMGDDYPVKTIGEVTTNDSDGVAESLNVSCTLQGTVYGVNFRPSGLQFTIIDDAGDGIGVFSPSEQFGYTVNEGDVIELKGTIAQFNGLTQIEPDSLQFIESGTIENPTSVTDLGEETESQLVLLDKVLQIDMGDWIGDGSSFNIVGSDGTNEYTIRIDSDVDLANMSAGSDLIKVTGIGGQFDSSSPYDDGYQLLPRYESDVEFVTATKNIDTDGSVEISPNPAQSTFTITSQSEIELISIFDLSGRKIMESKKSTITLLQSGVFMVHVQTNEGVAFRKLILL